MQTELPFYAIVSLRRGGEAMYFARENTYLCDYTVYCISIQSPWV